MDPRLQEVSDEIIIDLAEVEAAFDTGRWAQPFTLTQAERIRVRKSVEQLVRGGHPEGALKGIRILALSGDRNPALPVLAAAAAEKLGNTAAARRMLGMARAQCMESGQAGMADKIASALHLEVEETHA